MEFADWLFSGDFNAAIVRSLLVAISVLLFAIAIGLPMGTATAIYAFRGRRLFLALLALPLMVPSFLWAIGLSQILDLAHITLDNKVLRGLAPVYVFAAFATPLAVFAAFLATKSLSGTQIDAYRLAGSDGWVFARLMKRALPITFLTTLLAAIMTLSDPGPGQIFGFSGAASEILVSFSALYDFDLARRQSLILALVAIVVSLPFIVWYGPRLSSALLAKETTASRLAHNKKVRRFAPMVYILMLLFLLGMPFLGLIKPVLHGFALDYAFHELIRTVANTLFYALSAGFIGTLIAIGVVMLFAGKKRAILIITLALLIMVVPSSFLAVSIIQLGSSLSASWDWLFRSRLIVGLALGIHFSPVAILLVLKRYSAVSDSWFDAARISGVSMIVFYWRIIAPFLAPALALSVLIISLLASSEIGTVLLLRPPGEDSFPLSIFTVMANASESLVSTLCLLYIGLSAILLILFWHVLVRKSA